MNLSTVVAGLLTSFGAALVAAAGAQTAQNTDWATLGNSPDMQHHSDIAAIHRGNVGSLGLAWWTELPSRIGLVGNPLVKDGVIFQGGPAGQMFANDAVTGKLLWQFKPETDLSNASMAGYAGKQWNRGLALWGDKAIIATGNCTLIAVSQKTGERVWEARSCDVKDMFTITAAPRVGGGMVFTGNACMDSGATRGHVDAFDAETGKHLWRFHTVPGDPAKPQDSALYTEAAKTWGKGWYAKTHGCGSVWDAITYDEKLKQLYIGVGGPTPFDPSQRGRGAGDELFTNSIVALDARTGQYKWHFKQVPNDGWNYDASVGIMVADLPVRGDARRVVLSAPKNGFAYVLDAATGKFISGGAYAQMNWARGLDASGRPIFDPAAMYWKRSSKEAIVLPGGLGAHGWEALAFDPQSHVLFIPSMVMPMKVGKAPPGPYFGVTMDFYYGSSGDPKWKSHGEVVAWDTQANKVKWRSAASSLPVNGGLMHTAGGVVFQGMADGRLVALDDATGRELWSRQTGGAIRGAPSTVMLGGEQYVIVATGNGTAAASGSFVSKYSTTPQTQTPPRLLAFKLGATGAYPGFAEPAPTPKPAVAKQDRARALLGEGIFEVYGCSSCHGGYGAAASGEVPNLNKKPPFNLAHLRAVVKGGALAPRGMPQFADISEKELVALFAYITNEAWRAYEADLGSAPKR